LQQRIIAIFEEKIVIELI